MFLCLRNKVIVSSETDFHLSYQQQMYEEEHQTDDKSEGLVSSRFAEEMWEQVTDGGDVTLYCNKLKNGGYQNREKPKI